VLIKILRAFLRPYSRPLALIVALQLAATIATLYLPTLNADIIDNGVVKGDTGYIMTLGGVMLAISLGQILCSIVAVFYSARTSMAVGRNLRAAVFHRCRTSPPARSASSAAPSLITRTTNDVQQVRCWRCSPSPDGHRPDHVRRRDHHGAEPGTCRSPRCC